MASIFGNELQIFSCSSNRELAQRIADFIGIPLGQATVTSFPNGETFVKLEENVRGNDVFIVQSTCPPTNHHIMELLIMIDAARRASAMRITAVIPFYGYARQDRKDQPRVPITAKLVANLLVAAGVNRVITIDLHAQQIGGFFDIPVDHLYAAPVFNEYLKGEKLKDLVVVSPDVGAMKMAASYADMLGCGLAVVAKRRLNPRETEALYVVGEVEDKVALIVDDMTETGGTLCSAADILKKSGVREIYACVSHAILNSLAIQRFKKSPIHQIITTNTTPVTAVDGLPLKVLCISKLLGQAIERIHYGKSISSLFLKEKDI